MMYSIENKLLKIAVSDSGAELKGIYHKEQKQEYLWQADPAWWPRNAPVLFPIVGKLNKNEYRLDGKIYSLPQHGFARDNEFVLSAQSSNRLAFVLMATDLLREKYPFVFQLTIEYVLNDNSLEIRYEVMNADRKMMYFSIGAHPGFALQAGEKLSDYYIEFEKIETLDRHLLDEGVFNGMTERVVTKSNRLDLNDDLMKKDAIVFKDMKSSKLTLKSRRSPYSLKFNFPHFPYFGIWSKPGASFVCLEPWCGMADNKGFDGDLREKEGIVSLGVGETFERQFSITI